MKSKVPISVLTLLLCVFIYSASFAQTTANKSELQRIADRETADFNNRNAEAIRLAAERNIPLIIETPERRYAELQYFNESGVPQYYITDNANAAKTISTDQVYAGGSAGLSLTGSGITARQWDGGAVRTSHQELTGRAVMGDGATTLNFHSTHVAGTLIASGVQASAKGMAPAAQLRAFDWNNDAAEMATEASNGALFSNHSYGYIRGWYYNGSTWTWYGNTIYSTQEDYLFGFYDAQAQSWDNIAYNAPYYLICKSAGNDRDEGPTGGAYPKDGPYDCIAHAGIAKNVLTVGAVNDITTGYTGPSSVVMSPFSSWGPADDGRIKPDIVTNGVTLYSTDKDNNADYTTLSGTSMASPSAAGSLALLQQHWNNLNPGTYMRASTLKGLVIHTADEAGAADGPDYEFGWGLMNTKNAALKISEDQTWNAIDEVTLVNGGVYTRNLISDGTQPLKVTICWTDPAGTPVTAQLDPLNPMLVNNLNLKITQSAVTFYPWKLDRNNPTLAATNNSVNNVDNVEVVYIAATVAGEYTVTVDHSGSLSGGLQVFSIIISGATEGSGGGGGGGGGTAPVCTSPVSPVNGATNVSIGTDLTWAAADSATGYLLYFGTNNPPTNLANGTDLGNTTTYSPTNSLAYNQVYYWKIVPYNAYGQATGCAIWSFTTESSNYITLPYSESFETGFGQWAQATYDDFDWTRMSGSTPTSKTGPNKAHNGSYYIYTEASSPRVPGDDAFLEATFNFTGISTPEISLWYHMYGNQMGSLHVDAFYAGIWTTLWSISGQQQTSISAKFKNKIVSLASYANLNGVTLRIRGVCGSGERSDIAVDLVEVRQQSTRGPKSGEYDYIAEPVELLEDNVQVYGYNRDVVIQSLDGSGLTGELSVYNTMGQRLGYQQLKGSHSYQAGFSLKPGIYIVRFENRELQVSRKVMIF